MMKTIPGLENVEIMRPAYGMEYDSAVSGQLKSPLETKAIEGLYFAGQVNGRTGYEEAAAQGLLAAAKALFKHKKKPPFILKGSEAYIGVRISDLIAKKLDEPYLMFTFGAEHRLLSRQDNADFRLREYAYFLRLVDEEASSRFKNKKIPLRMKKFAFKKRIFNVDPTPRLCRGVGSTAAGSLDIPGKCSL